MGKQTAEIDIKVRGDKDANTRLGRLANTIKSKLVVSLSDLGRVMRGATTFMLSFLKTSGKFEGWRISFETMLGSVEEADKLLKQLADTAKTTPFELTEITAAAKQLLAVGVEADKVNETIMRLGDVAAGLGVPIGRLILNLGQIKSQAKLTGRELRDFAVAGVPLLEELAKTLNKSTVEISEMVSKGEIGFDTVQEAFKNMTSEGGRFNNLMIKQSKSLLGSWSNLKDGLTLLRKELGDIFLPIAKGTVRVLIAMADVTKNVTKVLKAYGGELLGLSNRLDEARGDVLDFDKALNELSDGGLQKQIDALERTEVATQQSITNNKIYRKALKDLSNDASLDALTRSQAQFKILELDNQILQSTQDREEASTNLGLSEEEQEERRVEREQARLDAMKFMQDQSIAGAAQGKAIIEKMEKEKWENIIDSNATAIQTLAGISKSGTKEFFEISKAAGIADATVSGFQAIGKAAAGAPFPFNLPGIAAETIRSASLIGGIEATRFAQGGQFERPNTSTTTSGQTAVDNEAGLERVTVEPIGQPESNSGGGGALVVQINLDGKQLAKQLYPQIKAIERSIS